MDVNIRVLIGLMQHPSGLPRVLKWSQRNSRSARKTQAETSSTKPRRCVMPPAPSLPGLPFLSRWVARARRSLSPFQIDKHTCCEIFVCPSYLSPYSL